MTYFGGTEHFSGKIGALSWSILVGKQKHNVQKPTTETTGNERFPIEQIIFVSFNPLMPVTIDARNHLCEKTPPFPCAARNRPKKRHLGTIAFPTLPEDFLVLLLFYCS